MGRAAIQPRLGHVTLDDDRRLAQLGGVPAAGRRPVDAAIGLPGLSRCAPGAHALQRTPEGHLSGRAGPIEQSPRQAGRRCP